MTKARKRKKIVEESIVQRYLQPTGERQAHNDFVSAGMAYRCTPVIDTLRAAGKLSDAQWAALTYYRDQAHRAEDETSCAEKQDRAGREEARGHCAATVQRQP